jgi:6-methylsalicylate decarboxylase
MVDHQSQPEPHRIDVHHHIMPPRYVAVERVHESMMRAIGGILGASAAHDIVDGWTAGRALEELDRNGISTGLPSIGSFGTSFGDIEQGRRLAREWNEDAAQLGRDHPGRFGLFATLPLTDVEGSLAEIEYALKVLEADGFGLITSYGTNWLGDPSFVPIFEELNHRRAVVFVHPTAPVCSCMMASVAPFLIETPTDTTRTITNLIMTGTLMRFPDIRFIFCHAGGTITAVAGRIGGFLDRRTDVSEVVPNGFAAELGKLYYDTAGAADRPAMSALMNLVPSNQILFGSDYPFLPIPATVGGLRSLGLTGTDLEAIERGNAQELLPRWRRSANVGGVNVS